MFHQFVTGNVNLSLFMGVIVIESSEQTLCFNRQGLNVQR
jgi:hypothetical protein